MKRLALVITVLFLVSVGALADSGVYIKFDDEVEFYGDYKPLTKLPYRIIRAEGFKFSSPDLDRLLRPATDVLELPLTEEYHNKFENMSFSIGDVNIRNIRSFPYARLFGVVCSKNGYKILDIADSPRRAFPLPPKEIILPQNAPVFFAWFRVTPYFATLTHEERVDFCKSRGLPTGWLDQFKWLKKTGPLPKTDPLLLGFDYKVIDKESFKMPFGEINKYLSLQSDLVEIRQTDLASVDPSIYDQNYSDQINIYKGRFDLVSVFDDILNLNKAYDKKDVVLLNAVFDGQGNYAGNFDPYRLRNGDHYDASADIISIPENGKALIGYYRLSDEIFGLPAKQRSDMAAEARFKPTVLGDFKQIMAKNLSTSLTEDEKKFLNEETPEQIAARGESAIEAAKKLLKEKIYFSKDREPYLFMKLFSALALKGESSSPFLENLIYELNDKYFHNEYSPDEYKYGVQEASAFFMIRALLDGQPEAERTGRLEKLLQSDNPAIFSAAIFESIYYPELLKSFLEKSYPTLNKELKKTIDGCFCYPLEPEYHFRDLSGVYSKIFGTEQFDKLCPDRSSIRLKREHWSFPSEDYAHYPVFAFSTGGIDFYGLPVMGPHYNPAYSIVARRGAEVLRWPGGGHFFEWNTRDKHFGDGVCYPYSGVSRAFVELDDGSAYFIQPDCGDAFVEKINVQGSEVSLEKVGKLIGPVLFSHNLLYHSIEGGGTDIYVYDPRTGADTLYLDGPGVGESNNREWGSGKISFHFYSGEDEVLWYESIWVDKGDKYLERKKYPGPFLKLAPGSLSVDEAASLTSLVGDAIAQFIRRETIDSGDNTLPEDTAEIFRFCSPWSSPQAGEDVFNFECLPNMGDGKFLLQAEARAMKAADGSIIPFVDKIRLLQKGEKESWELMAETDPVKGGFILKDQ